MLEPHRCVFHGLQWVGQSFIIKCEINSFIVIIQQSKQKNYKKNIPRVRLEMRGSIFTQVLPAFKA